MIAAIAILAALVAFLIVVTVWTGVAIHELRQDTHWEYVVISTLQAQVQHLRNLVIREEHAE